MLPVVLDVSRLRLALVGNGAPAERRLALLDEAGAGDLAVYADNPSPSLAHAAGARLVRRLPSSAELAAARLVFIAERGRRAKAHHLAATARAAGALVHVEDETASCDMHAPAILRRGDLLIAVSTGGRSPALALQVKRFLGALFGTEWQHRLGELAALRHGWRRGGADLQSVKRWTEEWVVRHGWLPRTAPDGGKSAPATHTAAAPEATFASRH